MVWGTGRARYGAALCGLALLGAAGCDKPRPSAGAGDPPAAAAAAGTAPTVLIVSIDTLRADRLGCYGKADAGTPVLDRLAAGGVRVAHAQTTAPLTLPAHTSLLTGRSLPAHGVFNNGTFALGPGVPTLAERFSKAGWATGAFVSSPVLARRYGLGRGFDAYDDRIVPARPSRVVHWEERPGAQTVKLALDWLAVQGAKPAFLWVHLFEPHRPYEPPPEIAARFPNDHYQGEVATADAAVGQLVDGLAAQGRAKQALVVVVGDHGEGLGEHGEQEHGILLYREDLQVPLVVRLPGDRRAGERVATPVELVDVLPTILDLVGVAAPTGLAGRSLFAGPLAADRALYAETFYPRLHLGWSELTSVVRGDRHAILGPDPELYDLARDPGERTNLRESERRTFTELRDLDRAARRPLNAPMAEDSETVAKLTALGYLGGGASLAGDQALPDPKAKIPTLAGYNDLLGAVSAQDFTRAVGLATSLCAENPRMADAWDLLGLSQARLGRHAEALAAYQKAMELTGGTPHLATAIANLYVELGKLDDAEKHARLALDGSPAAAHSILASVALGRKDYARAESEVEAALAAGGSKAGPLILLAQALCDQGKLDAALAATDRAIAALGPDQPKYSGLYLVRGDILARLGRFEDAGAAFEREIDQFPWDPKPYVKLAALLAAAERGDDATSVLKALLARNPASPSAFVEAVKALRVLGRPGDAAQVLAEARRRFAGARELAGL